MISFIGGEPFLWEPLADTARQLHAQGLRLSITTNGRSLSTPATRALLLDCFDEVVISVDGLQEHHDWCRGEPGLWQQVLAGTRLLVNERTSHPLTIKINTILTHRNIACFEEFCAELCDWGVDALSFNQLGGIARPEFFS